MPDMLLWSRAMKLRRALFALSGLLVATTLIACGPPPAKNTAKKVGKEAKVDDNSPTSLSDIKFDESPSGGDPAVVGCADGQREGFANLEKYPTIAGCLGAWEGKMTLRKGATGKACGDDGEMCTAPADACAPGWHVCASNGDYHDLSARIDDKQCVDGAGPGKFVAGISHVKKKKECSPPPTPTTRYPCFKDGYGAEPVCCGKNCRTGECRDSVWPKKTRISVGKAEGCGNVSSNRNGGILCCKDSDKPKLVQPLPTRVPPTMGEAAATEGTEAAAPEDGAKTDGEKADGEKAPAKKDDAKKAPAKKDDAKKADAKKEG